MPLSTVGLSLTAPGLAPLLLGIATATGSGATIDANMPAERGNGRRLFAIIARNQSAPPAPSGWTLMGTATSGSNNISCFTRLDDGTVGSTVTFGGGTPGMQAAWAWAVANSTGYEALHAGTTGTDSTVELPSITTLGSNRIVVGVGWVIHSNGTGTPWTLQSGTGTVTSLEPSFNGSGGAVTYDQPTAGAATRTLAVSNTKSGTWLATQFAIK